VFAFLSFGLLTAAAATGASKSGLFIAYVVLSVLYALSLFGATATASASPVRAPDQPRSRAHACTGPTQTRPVPCGGRGGLGTWVDTLWTPDRPLG
jgi:hypothetical protein